jgi:hypothetical protein
MNRGYVISFDVHCQSTEVVVLTPTGRIRCRDRVATGIPQLQALIESVRYNRKLWMTC